MGHFLQSYPKRAFANPMEFFAVQFDLGKVIQITFEALKCKPTKNYQKKIKLTVQFKHNLLDYSTIMLTLRFRKKMLAG